MSPAHAYDDATRRPAGSSRGLLRHGKTRPRCAASLIHVGSSDPGAHAGTLRSELTVDDSKAPPEIVAVVLPLRPGPLTVFPYPSFR
jgi:hypothetical protein